jgi:hypothetical protein
LHHPVKTLQLKTTAKISNQLSRQSGDNPLSMGRPFASKSRPQDAIPYAPIQRRESDVHSRRRLAACLFDQSTNLAQQICGATGLKSKLRICHLYLFTVVMDPKFAMVEAVVTQLQYDPYFRSIRLWITSSV